MKKFTNLIFAGAVLSVSNAYGIIEQAEEPAGHLGAIQIAVPININDDIFSTIIGINNVFFPIQTYIIMQLVTDNIFNILIYIIYLFL